MKKQILRQDANFLGLPEPLADFDNAKAIVWPIPYEATTTYAQGTAAGPAAILSASQQVELWDDELDCEPCEHGICTLPHFDATGMNHNEALSKIGEISCQIFNEGKFSLSLGGEHSVTIPLVKKAAEFWPDLSVLHFDAHSDLRQSYEGSTLNHACVMARVGEICPFVSVGLRSGIKGERANARSDSRLIYARQMQKNAHWIDQALAGLSRNVYLTFDLDFLDPSIMPSVGTPEPGGFLWYETLEFIRCVFRERNVVACDIVELKPVDTLHHPDFLAAKLAYKMIGYKLCI